MISFLFFWMFFPTLILVLVYLFGRAKIKKYISTPRESVLYKTIRLGGFDDSTAVDFWPFAYCVVFPLYLFYQLMRK